MPENRRAYNIQQFANFRVAHIQEVGQENNIAFPFGQSVKGFGKQFIFDEYIKAGHLKTVIIAFSYSSAVKGCASSLSLKSEKVTSRAARFARVRR